MLGTKINVPGSKSNGTVAVFGGDIEGDSFFLEFEKDVVSGVTEKVLETQRNLTVVKTIDGRMAHRIKLSKNAILALTVLLASDAKLVQEAVELFSAQNG